MRGAPGRSSIAPSVNVTTSVTGGIRSPPCRALYHRKPNSGPIVSGLQPTFAFLTSPRRGRRRARGHGPQCLARAGAVPRTRCGLCRHGKDDTADVVERAVHVREFRLERRPVAGKAGVYDGKPAVVLDPVAVDRIGTDAVKGACQLHQSSHQRVRRVVAEPQDGDRGREQSCQVTPQCNSGLRL